MTIPIRVGLFGVLGIFHEKMDMLSFLQPFAVTAHPIDLVKWLLKYVDNFSRRLLTF